MVARRLALLGSCAAVVDALATFPANDQVVKWSLRAAAALTVVVVDAATVVLSSDRLSS